MEMQALNYIMRGDDRIATALFEKAVQAGWRNYFFVINDPRWGDFFEQLPMRSLITFVNSDLDRQRNMIEEMDAEEDFRAVVEQLDANSRSEPAHLR